MDMTGDMCAQVREAGAARVGTRTQRPRGLDPPSPQRDARQDRRGEPAGGRQRRAAPGGSRAAPDARRVRRGVRALLRTSDEQRPHVRGGLLHVHGVPPVEVQAARIRQALRQVRALSPVFTVRCSHWPVHRSLEFEVALQLSECLCLSPQAAGAAARRPLAHQEDARRNARRRRVHDEAARGAQEGVQAGGDQRLHRLLPAPEAAARAPGGRETLHRCARFTYCTHISEVTLLQPPLFNTIYWYYLLVLYYQQSVQYYMNSTMLYCWL